MNVDVYISKEEFIEMFNKIKGNLRVCLDAIGIHPYMTGKERKEAIHKAFNPDIPRSIIVHDADGTKTYYVRR